MRASVLLIVTTALLLWGCGAQETQDPQVDSESANNAESQQASSEGQKANLDYEVISEEDFYIGNSGMQGKTINASTSATDEKGYRTVCENLWQEYPDSAALVVGFYGESEEATSGGPQIEGTCQWFQDAGVAAFVLGPGYSESNVSRIMEEGDGYLIVSLDDMEQELSGMM